MTYVFAAILALHGLVHVLGFVSVWRIGGGTFPMSPTLLASLDPDGPVMRLAGVLWLVPAVAFAAAAAGLVFDGPWWRVLVAPAAVTSLLLCIAWWSDAKVGAAFDLAILVGLLGTSWLGQTQA